jgi:ribosomal protein S18 acetylase RimI-like enzyme
VRVRRLGPDEAPLLRELRLRALREDPAAFWSTYEREVDHPDERWAAMLEHPTFVAGDGLGLVAALPEGDGLHVVGMWVAPEARGTGVADALLDAAIGDGPATLWVMTGNDRAERFYERRGFRRARVESDWFEMVRP